MTEDAKNAKDESFPFTHHENIDDITAVGSNHTWTWTTDGYTYYSPPTLETIDSKIENIKVLIKNVESRISVIEQHLLRLITKVEEVLDKVEKHGKV